MIVTGWGRILKTDSAYNDLLLKSTVVTMDNRNCDDIYSKRGRSLSNFEFCGVIGTNICFATQGSAAFKTKGDDSRAIIFGLTSDGGPECGSETPIIFTKISSYLNWIENIVWPGM
ncbi:Trypsin [Popillia japonica]|uniref:Trypsin n=1 Tax=Popillia japonica TaxID=7064 RepID=A0AAW1KGK9_POPJA